MIPLSQWLADRRPGDPFLPIGAIPGLAGAAPPLDVEALIAEAHARGYAEGEAAAREALDNTVAAAAAKHEEDLKHAAERCRTEALQRFTADLTAAFAGLQESLAEQIAAALTGFLEGGAKSKALLAFHAALDDLAETQPLIRIEGPQELIDELQKLGPLPPGVETRPVATSELRAVAGDTEIATALKRWLHAMHGDHP
jgi:hypothetical protein